MDTQDVLRQAREANLRLVRFLYCDNGGIIRGKATHASKLHTRIHEGIGQTLAMQAFTGVETLAPVEGMGPIGEFRLIPDPNTFVILPYAPSSGSMMCDMILFDGTPWQACPRTFLKRMITRLADHGMHAEGAIEHEFYLAREAQGHYIPADNSLCYSSIGLDDQSEVIEACTVSLEVKILTQPLSTVKSLGTHDLGMNVFVDRIEVNATITHQHKELEVEVLLLGKLEL